MLPLVIRPSDCVLTFGELPLAKQAVFAMYYVRRMLTVSPQYSGFMPKAWRERVQKDVRRDITLRILETVANGDRAAFDNVMNLHSYHGQLPTTPYIFGLENQDTMRLGHDVELAWSRMQSESYVEDRAAALIQERWRYAAACPQMLLCVRRLKRTMV